MTAVFKAAEQIEIGLAIAPQLVPDDLAAVAASCFSAVINNRPDDEDGEGQPTSAQIEAAARAAGLAYRHLPVPSAEHTAQQAQAMMLLVGNPAQPVLAFSRTGRRSAALYRMGKSLP